MNRGSVADTDIAHASISEIEALGYSKIRANELQLTFFLAAGDVSVQPISLGTCGSRSSFGTWQSPLHEARR
jgi:hypothetical protein